MEPVKIDWAKVESRCVTDEMYEHINAPKWADLSASFNAGSTGEEDAWFCRPDCRHPKSAEDFFCEKWRTPPPPTSKPKSRRDASKTDVLKTLAERNCNTMVHTANEYGGENVAANGMSKANSGNKVKKRREGGAVLFQIETPLRSPKSAQKDSSPAATRMRFDEDLENRNPNQTEGKVSKLRKEPFRHRVEKSTTEPSPGRGEENVAECEEGFPRRRRLRSTLSARNLFAGKDLLAQISGLYGEIKKWITVRSGEHHVASDDCSVQNPGEVIGLVEEEEKGLKMTEVESRCVDNDENLQLRKTAPDENPLTQRFLKTTCRRTAGGEAVKVRIDNAADGVHQQQPRPSTTTYAHQLGQQQDNVRSHPPSPQRFPSPMIRPKQCKPAVAATPSPLRPSSRPVLAPPRGRTILGDLALGTNLSPVGEKARGAGDSGKPLDLLWFMKPCNYLGR